MTGVPSPLTVLGGRAVVRAAWTRAEILETVEILLAHHEARLPAARDTRIVIKPNCNNDLVALTGNSVDLRVLWALLAALRRRGYRDVVVADGPNVGVERRGIDVLRRLGVDRVAGAHGARVVDLNGDRGREVTLSTGIRVRVAATVLEAGFLVSVPKVKTHAEAVLTSALKNQVGTVVGQDKRRIHRDLAANLVALHEVVRPDLVLLDGVVGMEGDGPGDGDPFRLGLLAASDHALLNDLVVCRLVGLPWAEVPCLPLALGRGWLGLADLAAVEREVPVVHPVRRARPRSTLAVLAGLPLLRPLRLALAPVTAQPAVSAAARRLRIVQDVYDPRDATLSLGRRDATRCGPCRRCEDFCPEGRTREEIGAGDRCLDCLACWLVCPGDALSVTGEARGMARQIARYRSTLAALA